MNNKYDIFEYLHAQVVWKQEPVNKTIGRLREAIKSGTTKRQNQLLEKIANDITELGVKFPKEVRIYE